MPSAELCDDRHFMQTEISSKSKTISFQSEFLFSFNHFSLLSIDSFDCMNGMKSNEREKQKIKEKYLKFKFHYFPRTNFQFNLLFVSVSAIQRHRMHTNDERDYTYETTLCDLAMPIRARNCNITIACATLQSNKINVINGQRYSGTSISIALGEMEMKLCYASRSVHIVSKRNYGSVMRLHVVRVCYEFTHQMFGCISVCLFVHH